MNKINWTNGRIIAVVTVWIVVVIAAFYGFFWRYIQPFDHQGLYPQGQVDNRAFVNFLKQHVAGNENYHDTLVFHWLDPDCFCTVYSGNTVEKLDRETGSEKLKHWVLVPPDKVQALGDLLPVLQDAKVVPLSQTAYRQSQLFIPATPAVVIFNQKEQSLSYLGPHSSGVVCGKGTGFVDLVLNNLQHGFDPQLYELEQRGCFCSW